MNKQYPPTLLIRNCNEFPNKVEANAYSTDGWDRMVDWQCNAVRDGLHGKKIQGGVEWHEEKKIKVPEWCPLRVKRNKV